jgi:hypothetical protein
MGFKLGDHKFAQLNITSRALNQCGSGPAGHVCAFSKDWTCVAGNTIFINACVLRYV